MSDKFEDGEFAGIDQQTQVTQNCHRSLYAQRVAAATAANTAAAAAVVVAVDASVVVAVDASVVVAVVNAGVVVAFEFSNSSDSAACHQRGVLLRGTVNWCGVVW